MGCTVVCDHQGHFLYVFTDYAGSLNDLHPPYKGPRFYRDNAEFFAEEEYLLGDTSYSLAKTVIKHFNGNDVLRMSDDSMASMDRRESRSNTLLGGGNSNGSFCSAFPSRSTVEGTCTGTQNGSLRAWFCTIFASCTRIEGTADAEANWNMANSHARPPPPQ